MKNLHLLLTLTAAVLLGSCITHPETTPGSGKILTYSTTSISELASNDGSFDSSIEITLSGDTFVPTFTEGTDYGTIGLPDGLTATLTRNSDTSATLVISGQLEDSTDECNVDEASFYFTDSAFESGKSPVSFEVPIKLSYISPTLTFSASELDEDSANDASFPQSITVTAANGGTFAKSGTLLEGTDYTWSLPAGLSTLVQVTSPTTATIKATGLATSHTPLSDTTSSFHFTTSSLNSAFCSGHTPKKIDFKFYRSIIMYNAGSFTGAMGGRTAMDGLCTIKASTFTLPSDYDTIKAFISVNGADEIQDINFPDVKVESTTSFPIADHPDATSLLSGTIINALGNGGVVPTAATYWTGSLDDGSASGPACTGWTSTSGNGRIGDGGAVDTNWLNSSTDLCSTLHYLLCVTFVSP